MRGRGSYFTSWKQTFNYAKLYEIMIDYAKLNMSICVKSSYYWHTCHTKIELRFSLVNRNQVKSKFLFEAWERPDSKAMFKHVQVLRTGQWKVPWPAKFNPAKQSHDMAWRHVTGQIHGFCRIHEWWIWLYLIDSDIFWLDINEVVWCGFDMFEVLLLSSSTEWRRSVRRELEAEPRVDHVGPGTSEDGATRTAAYSSKMQNTCETMRKDAESYQCALTIPDPTKSNWGKGWLQQ